MGMALLILDLCTPREKETWLHFYNFCGLKLKKLAAEKDVGSAEGGVQLKLLLATMC